MSSDPEAWDVFISYARLDVAAVAPIQRALEARGLRVWRDEDEIESFEAITRGVRGDGVARSRSCLRTTRSDTQCVARVSGSSRRLSSRHSVKAILASESCRQS